MIAPLNQSQVLILQCLAKHADGLTTPALAKKSGATVNSGTVGPVFDSAVENYPESLHARKLVKVEKREEGIVWKITAKGKQVAPTLKTRKRTETVRVPAEVLNPAVLKFAPTRTYGIEAYSLQDLTEIRETLPAEFAELNLEDLREQITNQRKRGAYADPANKIIMAVNRTIRDFGPDGSIKAILSAKQVEELRSLLP